LQENAVMFSAMNSLGKAILIVAIWINQSCNSALILFYAIIKLYVFHYFKRARKAPAEEKEKQEAATKKEARKTEEGSEMITFTFCAGKTIGHVSIQFGVIS
jgi:Ca2+/Na+ antiporter